MAENLRIALVPAYEPDEKMLDLLPQLKEAGLQVLIVDDGSGSDYAPLFLQAAEFGTVLTHTVNRGKGAAIKTALTYIREHYPAGSIIVTVDADGQHRTPDVLRLCQAAEKAPGTLILGSRALQEHVPLRSRFGNTVTRWVFTLSTGLRIHDTQTGLRAFDSSLLPFMEQVAGERYEYEMNVLLDCSRKKIPISELPIATVYLENNASSHFNPLKDSFRVYKEILKFSASSFAGFLVDYAMFAILSALTSGLGNAGVWVSNVGARAVSGSVNFLINRRLVFHSSKPLWKEALGYVLLAVCILLCNTVLMDLLVNRAGLNRYAVKIPVEIVFFFVNWSLQHFVIFKRRK